MLLNRHFCLLVLLALSVLTLLLMSAGYHGVPQEYIACLPRRQH